MKIETFRDDNFTRYALVEVPGPIIDVDTEGTTITYGLPISRNRYILPAFVSRWQLFGNELLRFDWGSIVTLPRIKDYGLTVPLGYRFNRVYVTNLNIDNYITKQFATVKAVYESNTSPMPDFVPTIRESCPAERLFSYDSLRRQYESRDNIDSIVCELEDPITEEDAAALSRLQSRLHRQNVYYWCRPTSYLGPYGDNCD